MPTTLSDVMKQIRKRSPRLCCMTNTVTHVWRRRLKWWTLHCSIEWVEPFYCMEELTHWGRVKHICIGNLTIIGSYDGLSPGRHQAIIWTNAGILLSGPLGTNFSEILIKIITFSLKKMHLKMLPGKWQPFCLSLNVLTHWGQHKMATIFHTSQCIFLNENVWILIKDFTDICS